MNRYEIEVQNAVKSQKPQVVKVESYNVTVPAYHVLGKLTNAHADGIQGDGEDLEFDEEANSCLIR